MYPFAFGSNYTANPMYYNGYYTTPYTSNQLNSQVSQMCLKTKDEINSSDFLFFDPNLSNLTQTPIERPEAQTAEVTVTSDGTAAHPANGFNVKYEDL
uniref:Uncharacterized protein n=2 Tax=Bursaphelenchus xylophilus TaxID=6326 RepID=A0A1I7SNL8_BURXY